MADVLVLAGIPFTNYSPPERMGAGGKQAMVVHKLPGGSRVIDTLGPDEADIEWRGQIFDPAALQICLALDAIRAAGQVVSLTFAGQSRQVIVSKFKWLIRRLPIWAEYEVCCTVYQNPSLGSLTTTNGGVDALVTSDLGAATAINEPVTTPAGSGGIGAA